MGAILVDIALLALVAWYVYNGRQRGFMQVMAELLGVVIAFGAAAALYAPVSRLITKHYGTFRGSSDVLAFLGILTIGFITYYAALGVVLQLYEKEMVRMRAVRYDRELGIVSGFLLGLIIALTIVALVMTFPGASGLQRAIEQSRFGAALARSAESVTPVIERQLGRPVDELIAFLTPESQKDKNSIGLPDVSGQELTIDIEAERTMLNLINKERAARDEPALVVDPALQEIARQHSREMWVRRYFAHESPASGSPFDRMNENQITFMTAGENIALAPNVYVAHTGLMNSPGHRANILDSSFGKVGIGIVSANGYGAMFTQDFTN